MRQSPRGRILRSGGLKYGLNTKISRIKNKIAKIVKREECTFYYDNNNDAINPNQLSAGSYTVEITDDNGCELIQVFDIDQPDSPEFVEISVNGDNAICADQMAVIEATSGFDNYIWSETIDGTIFPDCVNE